MQEVHIDGMALDRLADLLEGDRARAVAENAASAGQLFEGRVVWNVNATASGGGVAEMLQGLLSYSRGAGVDTRWLVLDGDAEFFEITKRLHNVLHGTPGDGGELGDAEREAYERALAPNVEELKAKLGEDDIVLLHDPQTAGMIAPLRETGVLVVWRSHIGTDRANEHTDRGWQFLRPYVEQADGTVFSRAEYVPEWVDPDRVHIIPPSLDPFSTKNADLEDEDIRATLSHSGLVSFPDGHPVVEYVRRDGSTGTVHEHDDLFAAGDVVPADVRVVLQVSRWDRLKDMGGVMTSFADAMDRMPEDVHLMLVGPAVAGVSDDPEGAEVLAECVDQWKALPTDAQARIHLATLPMEDVDENAHIVNALQRHAEVVVQKSLVEGFGLTVTEPMWKARPVVASSIGGIQDQIDHGESGLLLEDPEDLETFADLVVSVLTDQELASRLGEAARERVKDRFLGDRHLIQYADLFGELLER